MKGINNPLKRITYILTKPFVITHYDFNPDKSLLIKITDARDTFYRHYIREPNTCWLNSRTLNRAKFLERLTTSEIEKRSGLKIRTDDGLNAYNEIKVGLVINWR